MQLQALMVADEAVSQILSKLNQQLKVKELVKYIAEYNQGYVSKMANAGAGTAYMQHPILRHTFSYNQMNQDQYPDSIPLDQFANYEIKLSVEGFNGPVIREKEVQGNSKQTTRQRKTGSTFRGSSTRNKQHQEIELLSKYFVIPPNTNNDLYQLPAQPPTKQQVDLEFELRAMQKKLYYTRKAKKEEEQKEDERMKALKRRKSPEMPRTDFTYELNGGFMRRKPFKSDSLLVQQMKHSQSFDIRAKDKKSMDELLEQVEETRGRSQLNSRYQKSNLFNNSNKRQVSHLPFIKLSDNSKIRQQNKNCQGSKTQRLSLKSFTDSLEQKSFKHHSQLQREKKQRQLIQKLEARRLQNKDEQEGKNPEEPEDNGYNNLMKRRKSYLMNKYLKKLKEQGIQQTKKSLNFNRVSFPKSTAIHSYYKHDFNEQRKLYESEVISRVLQNSGNGGKQRY